MIKAIFFDLDNTILDTHSLGERILDPVLAPLLASDLSEGTKKAVSAALWNTSYEDVFKQFSILEALAEEMRVAARNLELPTDKKIKSYGDEKYIKKLLAKKFLVTTGFTRFQMSKIQALGIAGLFDGIIIDQVDDLSKRKKKKEIFSELMHLYRWTAQEILVVGDNPRSELRAAKELGITAVQTLRPGVQKWDEADYHIDSLDELSSLIK